MPESPPPNPRPARVRQVEPLRLRGRLPLPRRHRPGGPTGLQPAPPRPHISYPPHLPPAAAAAPGAEDAAAAAAANASSRVVSSRARAALALEARAF